MGTDGRALGLALGAYIVWGFLPVYWKILDSVDALEILAHRIAWSLVFLIFIVVARKRTRLFEIDRRTALVSLVAAALLTTNWGLYIWAVNSGRIVETALGYFINPLVNVGLGALLLGERPRRLQWWSVGLAAAGVLYLTWAHGRLPWISLVLATSFALYGLLKKKAPLGPIDGLLLESALLIVPAVTYLVFLEFDGKGTFGHAGLSINALLVLSGAATAFPLILFAAAVRRLPLTVIGVMQYLAPTIQFLLGVFVYDEAFSWVRFAGFLFIWSGVLLFMVEGLHHHRRISSKPATPPPIRNE